MKVQHEQGSPQQRDATFPEANAACSFPRSSHTVVSGMTCNGLIPKQRREAAKRAQAKALEPTAMFIANQLPALVKWWLVSTNDSACF
jgi:hypothetical protein